MDYNDEALAWFLFMDSCAILQFIYCASTMDKFKDLSIKDDSVAFVHHDLILLENQLPYSLLVVDELEQDEKAARGFD